MRWKQVLGVVAAAAAIWGIAHAKPNDFVGEWTGLLQPTPVSSLKLVLNIKKTDDGLSVSMDSPDQSATNLVADKVTVNGNTIEMTWSFGAQFSGVLNTAADPNLISGKFQQSGLLMDLVFAKGSIAPVVAGPPPIRPQVPQPPLPYIVEDVSIPVPGTDVILAGTLTTPKRAQRNSPAVVLITGSGPQDRDQFIDIAGHKTFLVLSDHLTRQGITVLRYDDRGVAKSTGHYEGSTMQDFAADAAAALAYVKARHHGPVGFLGHSEGGVTAILSTTDQGTKPAFIASLASPFVPLADVFIRQSRDLSRANGASEAQVAQSAGAQSQIIAAAQQGTTPEEACANITAATAAYPESVQAQAKQLCTPWAFSILRIDIAGSYKMFKRPVLAIFGTLDLQVAADESAPLADTVLSNRNSKVVTFENTNHLFQTATTGSISEYGQIEETMRPDVMQMIADWIIANAK